jgi:hypothetical protein
MTSGRTRVSGHYPESNTGSKQRSSNDSGESKASTGVFETVMQVRLLCQGQIISSFTIKESIHGNNSSCYSGLQTNNQSCMHLPRGPKLTAVIPNFFQASSCVGRVTTAEESVINVREHRDKNGKEKEVTRF